MNWPDGTEYDGKWVNDAREGLGILKSPDGSTYNGHWSED